MSFFLNSDDGILEFITHTQTPLIFKHSCFHIKCQGITLFLFSKNYMIFMQSKLHTRNRY